MLVRLAILNGSSQTVAHAVEDVGKGLHLVYIISLRNGQLAEHMGIGVDVAGASDGVDVAGASDGVDVAGASDGVGTSAASPVIARSLI